MSSYSDCQSVPNTLLCGSSSSSLYHSTNLISFSAGLETRLTLKTSTESTKNVEQDPHSSGLFRAISVVQTPNDGRCATDTCELSFSFDLRYGTNSFNTSRAKAVLEKRNILISFNHSNSLVDYGQHRQALRIFNHFMVAVGRVRTHPLSDVKTPTTPKARRRDLSALCFRLRELKGMKVESRNWGFRRSKIRIKRKPRNIAVIHEG
ncbi:hypothetical protein G7K_6694-t1 [Saitoella complicata NRRL Y-17804]|uniref:Uncharacterized protein n=1 Tax=Saitoella complicata (strain BCRC 22490 / CBS 7301 / JCM 7358 / NBRC 10748 / NRRL Y-17804) TaxID=698492 RepID=A0A0E9NSH9_SAICN|nr:hypothetical protein G7K_6694-t1 [Saitoella complicata NRRL Y-17804]